MVISEPALICLETSHHSFLRGFAALWFGPPDVVADPAYTGSERPPVRVEPAAVDAVAPMEPACAIDAPLAVQEEQSMAEAGEHEGAAPLTAQERRARSAALRGLLLGRQRRFAAAQAAFVEAARLDPELSLESVPTFWDMERGAHEAAVRAYREAGRAYDASMLASRLRTTFRPRLVNTQRRTPSPAG